MYNKSFLRHDFRLIPWWNNFELMYDKRGVYNANFVVANGTVVCGYDNLRCLRWHQWRQSWQCDNCRFLFDFMWRPRSWSALVLDNGYCWWNQIITRHNVYLILVKSRRIQLHAYKLHIVLVLVIQSFNNHDFGMCNFSGSSETMKESRHYSWIFRCSFSTHSVDEETCVGLNLGDHVF